MFHANIYRADCIDVLRTLEPNSIDCIFIDPPYRTGNKTDKSIQYDQNEDFAKKKWTPFYAEWDAAWSTIDEYIVWVHEWMKEVKRVLTDKGTIYICGSFHNIPWTYPALNLLDMYTIQWLQWCIPNAFPNLSMTKQINANQTIIIARKSQKITHYYDKEAAKRYNDGKNLRDYWIINQDTRGRWKHPSKKPFDLVYRALDIATPKDRPVHILDFFAGSGTTGEASAHFCQNYQTDVYCTLVEQDPTHAQTCYDRTLYGCETSKITDRNIQTFF